MQCIPANMADEGPNRRRRYKEYMRHHNPYKFEAARRSRRRLGCRKPDPNSKSGNNRSDPESKIREVFNCDVNSSVHVRDKCSSESAAITTNQLPRDEQMKDILETRDFGFEEVLDGGLSEDDLSNNPYAYERFVREDDNYTSCDSASDYEDYENCELASEQCGPEADDNLYSGAPLTTSMSVVLLLTFATKHKLTRAAFNDLLSVIEAHCPHPNNCKTSVSKLLEFTSQAKGDIQKHYFCDYCKAYHGKSTFGNCNICGRSISKANGFFIEVPIGKQLQRFFTGKLLFYYIK